ncbi:MAG: hypothetical protein SGPRY_005806 [Prymnesium sp.]
MERLFQDDLTSLIDATQISKQTLAVRNSYARFKSEGIRSFPQSSADLLCDGSGFALRRCLSHGSFAWRVRSHPAVHAAFATLFPSEPGPLVSSLDVTFFRPSWGEEAGSAPLSAHADMNLHDVREQLRGTERETYQGALYLWPALPHARPSCTVVWPRSHTAAYDALMRDGAFRRSGACGEHYSEVRSMDEPEAAHRLAEEWAAGARRVQAPAGSLLIWNSKLIHTGWKEGPRLAQAVYKILFCYSACHLLGTCFATTHR